MGSHSIQAIDSLQSISSVEAACKALAVMDLILMPDWEYRYFSYNAKWNPNSGDRMASMRNGHGDHYFILFTKFGAVGKIYLKHFNHNTQVDIDTIPYIFQDFKQEKAFRQDECSLYFWREENTNYSSWLVNPSAVPYIPLLGFIVYGINYYVKWATNYYERNISIEAANEVWNNLRLTSDNLTTLNNQISIDSISTELKEILG